MNELSIAPPYAFAALDTATAAAFEAGLKGGLGAMASLVHVGARSVTKDGAAAGLVVAMSFPGIPGTESDTFLDSVANGAAGSSKGKTTSRTIHGHDVRIVEASTGVFALYKHGTDTIVMAVGRTVDQAAAIVTAVIEASE